jgi:hypothetical protein
MPEGAQMKPIKRQKPYGLRMPNDLKSWLEVKARENKRSLNNEIGFVLESYRAQNQKREASHG